MSGQKESFSLKDHLFNEKKLELIAYPIAKNFSDFNNELFIDEIIQAFPTMELKQRISHIAVCLRKYLPDNYRDAVQIILDALPPALDEDKSDNDFGEFIYASYGEFVAIYGCNASDLSYSLSALKEITKRFSAEYAIRPFINNFFHETMHTLLTWCDDNNYHVRRLCSEGSRPRLPWGQKIMVDPKCTIPILEKLYTDSTRYVTRSVANHMNDLAKTHPELVVSLLSKWRTSTATLNTELDFICKHATRTLIKNGYKPALELMGYGDANDIQISALQYSRVVKIGEVLIFSLDLHATKAQKIVIDYCIRFQSKNKGRLTEKVFKLKSFDAIENQKINISKNHPMKAAMTTRTLYPGVHRVLLKANGGIIGEFDFDLE